MDGQHFHDIPPPGFDLLGVEVSRLPLAEVEAYITRWAADDIGRFVCLRDVPSLMLTRRDAAFRALHRRAALVLPDGMPIAWAGRARGHRVTRLCGSDLFDAMCRASVESGLRHYFYGGKPGVAARLAARCRQRYPGIRIAGYESPPFGPRSAAEDAAETARIRASGADIVWVGMSSPKQDHWMAAHVDRLPQTLIGVGAVFDFQTGAVRRAPVWMQRRGLEWAHRLAQEPRRLWRRYLVLAPLFVWHVALSRRTGERP